MADDAGNKTNLYFDFTTLLRSVRDPSVTAQDFLLVATTVYALDKLVPRSKARDQWSRSFEVTIPVEDPAAWKKVTGIANDCLSFLSGDDWNVQYTKRTRS